MEHPSAAPSEKTPLNYYTTYTWKESQEVEGRRFITPSIEHTFIPPRPPPSSKRLFKWVLLLSALLSFAMFLFSLAYYQRYTTKESHPPKFNESDTYDAGAPFAPVISQRSWGAYSPYYSVEEYPLPPENCRLTQVNTIQRHGARFPTSDLSAAIAPALRKLQAAEYYTDDRLRFLADYHYDLGKDDLVPFGEYQSYESGRKAFLRYESLTSAHDLPFVRASGSDRVIESAFKWIDGFRSATHYTLEPVLGLIIPETKGFNNTLENKSCPNAYHSNKQVEEWRRIYAGPIAERLNSAAHGMPESLTARDAESLIALCAMETVAKEEYSPFCDLFTQKDFEGYEYSMDLDKFYHTGYGSRLGPVQGIGYVNELLARLTDQPVQDHTQSNHTLNSNPETFPLGRGIYIDFSHDNLIVAVISAMGLKDDDLSTLDPTEYEDDREWNLSRVVPFSGRMVVERMECSDTRGSGRFRRDGAGSQVYVRVLIDDAVQDLDICMGSREGLCTLENFVESQRYARENGQGDWERCFD